MVVITLLAVVVVGIRCAIMYTEVREMSKIAFSTAALEKIVTVKGSFFQFKIEKCSLF